MYAGLDNGNMDTYMMPGTELNQRLPSPAFENSETMTNDGTSGYIVDPSLYYPAASGYSYYYTGFESPGEWDENQAVYGVDTTNVYMAPGAQSENVPYVYYATNYGYGDTPFNPYNPYIPGAMIGVDGSYVGTQPYYVSPYSDPVSTPEYYSALVHSGTNVIPSGSTNTISDVGPSTTHRMNNSSIKHTHSSSPASFPVNHPKSASGQTSLTKGGSQFPKANTGTTKLPMSSRTNGSGVSASSHVSQNGSTLRSLQSIGTLLPEINQPKLSYPAGGSSYDSTTTTGQAIVNDEWSKFFNRRTYSDLNGRVDPLSEQNRGPRTKKSKNQIVVKAYTTKAGNCNSEGNIVISADDYNKDDLPLDYTKAKFFVIKSYSEDDVHKSIKYNVWSSTPNGNRKLNSAYEDAQKLAAGNPRGCPIFMFFSVNASGQFCGVAEMIGPVEFDRDMDFWQQDKWSGSFPVKWHIIKDVSNPTFRHIILENNEHKPVTNSRDTQEILHKPGLEMLKVFKNYTSKTSLLDDFIYYENRQKIMFEDRARLLQRANVHGHAYAFQQPIKLNNSSLSRATADHVTDQPQKDATGAWVEKVAQLNNSSTTKTEPSLSETALSSTDSIQKSVATNSNPNPSELEPTQPSDNVSTLKIGSLSIHPKPKVEPKTAPLPSSIVNTSTPKTTGSQANVLTVGSMPIKVGVVNKSPRTVTIGTIALDPKALQNSKGGFSKGGLQK